MAKYLLSWETVYGEDDDITGTAVVEAETADQAKKEFEEKNRMTIVYNVTEYTESEDEDV